MASISKIKVPIDGTFVTYDIKDASAPHYTQGEGIVISQDNKISISLPWAQENDF